MVRRVPWVLFKGAWRVYVGCRLGLLRQQAQLKLIVRSSIFVLFLHFDNRRVIWPMGARATLSVVFTSVTS